MATLDFITKQDIEQLKQELFAELRRPTFKTPTEKNLQRPWIKSYEVRKLLDISLGTLQHWRKSRKLKFEKIGGLIYYKYEDIEALVEGKNRKSK